MDTTGSGDGKYGGGGGSINPGPDHSMVTFDTGAKRSKEGLHYSSIDPGFLRRIAARHTGAPAGQALQFDGREYEGGDGKYGRGNWRKGMPLHDTFNHVIEHLLHWREVIATGAIPTDDDLAGAGWGIEVLMVFEKRYANIIALRLGKEAPYPEADQYVNDDASSPLVER